MFWEKFRRLVVFNCKRALEEILLLQNFESVRHGNSKFRKCDRWVWSQGDLDRKISETMFWIWNVGWRRRMRRMAIHQVVHSNNSHDRKCWYDLWWIWNRFARLRQYIKWCIQHISKTENRKWEHAALRRDKTFLKVISSLFLLTTLLLWLFGNILTSFYIFFDFCYFAIFMAFCCFFFF